jgi:hypothetical protein
MSRPRRELTRELIDRMCELRGSGYSTVAMCGELGLFTAIYYRWFGKARRSGSCAGWLSYSASPTASRASALVV